MKIKKGIIVKSFITIAVLAIIISSITLSTKLYASKDSTYQYLDNLAKAIAIIEENYVSDVDLQKLIYGAIQGMLTELDPHSSFLTPDLYEEFRIETEGEFGGLGITIGIKDNLLTIIAPLEDTPASKAGIKAGDIIVKINDITTSGITLEEAVKKMRGDPGTKVTLTIFRKGQDKPFDIVLTREIIKIASVKSKMYNDIAYLKLIQFNNKATDELTKAIKKLKKDHNITGVVLDLRNNPGGLLSEAIKTASLFLPRGKTVVFTKDRNNTEQYFKTENVSYRILDIPVVILVNGGSASASEIVAGAMQDHKRSLVVGSQTFGKASVQTVIPMPDRSAIKLTTALYYTPNGRSIQGVGIKPDVIVPEGKIIVDEASEMFTESSLEKHIVGENEKILKRNYLDNETKESLYEDLQLNIAMEILKGLIAYGDSTKNTKEKL
jgi:carboxyl-terminal processing protease